MCWRYNYGAWSKLYNMLLSFTSEFVAIILLKFEFKKLIIFMIYMNKIDGTGLRYGHSKIRSFLKDH